MSFDVFNLDPLVIDAIREMGFEKPAPIQQEAIPPILEGKDLIALAETGSGKTAACAIPICSKVDTNSIHIQTLIIVPTRELALQYATETQKVGRFKKVKVFALFGGEDLELQKAKLKAGVQVLIATPGRLIDFVYSHLITLTHVETLVLDEADQMLGMGFYEDLEFIMQCLIQKHQTLLFSATMPKEIRVIAKTHMVNPVELSLITDQKSPSLLEHQFLFCKNPSRKREELVAILEKLDPSQCLIFANSRREVEDLTRMLKGRFSSVDFLHGGLDQNLRTLITSKFSKGKIRYLIATDVAARGLDFTKVTHVLNYHFPLDKETYVHRAGRTGRFGKEGLCVTLVTARELKQVERLLKTLDKEAVWIGQPPK